MANQILVVDDDRMSRLVTQTILEKLGFDVVALPDGRGVAEAQATGAFDAVVMDCQMPQVDGFRATEEIRRREANSDGEHTPIIGLSARSMDGDEDAALATGMDVYIVKPLTVRKMKDALDEVFGEGAWS